ncbi:hypothetical protein MCUN1_001626 [Malassezia cuniculi]|uniref:Vacuolar protein-sorting-associated protein 25 n=1 Tax=Malassezia cuniculi TaxID=948313 RepID=A0AAF0J5S2_9BASI|nr:hypothetical protein MCUN1_001626 [Malassezia cuniculi]
MNSHGAFEFPPLHSFAPFYTLQPNIQTAQTQIEHWGQLVLSYCAVHRRFTIDAYGEFEQVGPLFRNEALDRAASPELIRLILAHLVSKGRAVYDPPLPRGVKAPTIEKTPSDSRTNARSASSGIVYAPSDATAYRATIYWKLPEEWADALASWVSDTGQNGSIFTLFELVHGDFGKKYGELPLSLLRLAIEVLTKRGRAQLVKGTGDGEWADGVKIV